MWHEYPAAEPVREEQQNIPTLTVLMVRRHPGCKSLVECYPRRWTWAYVLNCKCIYINVIGNAAALWDGVLWTTGENW